jgi:hypothetical protein
VLGCAVLALLAGVGPTRGATSSAMASQPVPRSVEVLASTSSAPSGAAGAAGTVYVEGSYYQPHRLSIKRHGYYHNVSIHDLTWSGWGEPQATAHGTFTYQFCVKESCSVSPFYDEPVTVTLSGIGHCRGRLLYTTLALDIEGSMPDSSFQGYRASVGSCRR